MTKWIGKAYIILFVILGICALFYVFAFHVNITDAGKKQGFVELQVTDVSEQAYGENRKIRVHLGEVSGDSCHLIFYTIHKTVSVFQGPVRIYAMAQAKGNGFSKTPGCVWNDILLTEDMSGKDLVVNLSPVYKGCSYGLPEFYMGTKSSIMAYVLKQQIFSVMASVILSVMGIAMVVYVFYNRKNTEVDRSLQWLGIFTFFVALWKITDSSVTKMLFHGMPVFSLLPFIALGLTVVPFLLYISELFSSKDDKVWMIPCGYSMLIVYVSLFLQYFSIVDLRQMMVWIWSTLLVGGIVLAYQLFREFQLNRWSAKLRRNLLGVVMVVVGFVLDLISYFVRNGRNMPGFVIFGFMIFIIVQGFLIFKESGALIQAGDAVQTMEDYALHDKLTGLFNRAAFITDTDPYSVNPDNYAVAVMDLNDLKKCNDTLGHEVGDRYIKDSAALIEKTFGSIGSCYRMGGDEFYCLIPQGGKKACREQEAKMEELIREYNAKSPDLKISIACGFARYDQRMDYDLNATAKRADKAMYQRKEEMKGHKKVDPK